MDKTLELIMGSTIGSIIQEAFEATSVETLACILGVGIIVFTIIGTNLICPRKW